MTSTTKEEGEIKPAGFSARPLRIRVLFAIGVLGLVLLMVAVIGLPIAEVLTRSVVRRNYIEEVRAYNEPAGQFRPVYTYKGYIADADDEIEYRLFPDSTRSVAIVPGLWRRTQNPERYLASAWNLVDSTSSAPKGFLVWMFVGRPDRGSWFPLFSDDAEELAMISGTNFTLVEPADFEAFIASPDTIAQAALGRRWRFVAGSPGSIVQGDAWHYVPEAVDVPRKDWMWRSCVGGHGFRSRTTPVRDDARRIVFLGDSFLFGWGVHDHESLTEQLEARFLAAAPEATTIQCVNLGVPGYNIEQEFLVLSANQDRVRADAVVLCCTANDLEPQIVVPYRPERIYRHAWLNSWFIERSKPLVNSLLPLDRQLPLNRYIGAIDVDASWTANRVKLADGRAAVAGIADHCRKHGIPLMLVSFPTGRERGAHAKVLGGWAKELGIPFVDLRVAVLQQRSGSLEVSVRDRHPNARAHGLFAAALESPLRGLLARGWDYQPPTGPVN